MQKENNNPKLKQEIEYLKKEPSGYFAKILNYANGKKTSQKFKQNITSLNNHILSIEKDVSRSLYKSLSCIFGSFMADSMGSYCEFQKANKNNYLQIYKGTNIFNKQIGSVTDDSEMAMSMAFSIMDTPDITNIDQNINYFYYGVWLHSKPCDIGNATLNAIKPFNPNKYYINSKCFDLVKNTIATVNHKSKANGCLMRLATFIVWYYYIHGDVISKTPFELYYDIKSRVKYDTEITHPNSENFVVAAIIVYMSLIAFNSKGPNDVLIYLCELINSPSFDQHSDEKNVKKIILDFISECQSQKFNYEAFVNSIITHSGFYGHALKIIIYVLVNFGKIATYNPEFSAYRNIINEICNYGGDTDTNACICGLVIGPIIGYLDFGVKDLNIFLNCIPIRSLYTPSLMYYYVLYLESITKNGGFKSNFVRFNTYELISTLFNCDIKLD